MKMNNIFEIKQQLEGLDLVEKLRYLAQKYQGKIVFSTSFGWEDQVVTHLIFSNNIPIKVFTLETGRLFPETYYVWNRTLEIYQRPIHAYFPQSDLLQDMVAIPLLIGVSLIAPSADTAEFKALPALAAVVAVVLTGRYLIGYLLHWVAHHGSRELFVGLALLLVIDS